MTFHIWGHSFGHPVVDGFGPILLFYLGQDGLFVGVGDEDMGILGKQAGTAKETHCEELSLKDEHGFFQEKGDSLDLIPEWKQRIEL